MVRVSYTPLTSTGLKVGEPANFKIWQNKEGRMYCFPEIVSRGELMRFTEIDIDGDGVVEDIVGNVFLTRSECKKNGWGSFDKILQGAENVQNKNGQNVLQPSSSEAKASGEAGQLENVSSYGGDNDSCRTVDNVDDVKEEKNEL